MNNRICNVDKCNRPGTAIGMCNLHYQRHINGRPLVQEEKPVYAECTVDGCTKSPRSRHATMCAKHYHRVYRYGSVNPVHEPRFEDVTGKRFASLIALSREPNGYWLCRCDCGRTNSYNLGSLNNGSALTCGDKKTHYRNANTYASAHSYVRQDRGPASQHECVDCHAPAKHWSYVHGDPGEARDWSVKGAPFFSTNPDYYEPRCVSCHKLMDLQVARQRTLAER